MRTAMSVGDEVSDSAIGAGKITGFSDVGFPQVNHVTVAWIEYEDGACYDPYDVREKHKAERAAKAASTFKCPAPEGYVQPDEPECFDGHDYEGFPGGCERMGCRAAKTKGD